MLMLWLIKDEKLRRQLSLYRNGEGKILRVLAGSAFPSSFDSSSSPCLSSNA